MLNKFILSAITLIFIITVSRAQSPPPIDQPQASPRAKVMQTIGKTEVIIDYSRPAVNGRDILGSLVPYNEIWRAGANENTRISFSTEVLIGGKSVSAGTYGLHMIPEKENWTIIINKDHESWGSYFYEEENDIIRISAKKSNTEIQKERLSYGFENITPNGADAYLHWSDFKVVFPIKVETEKIMVNYLEEEYLKNIAGFFWQGFNGAANYTLANDISLDKGISWVDVSISMNENFANMSTKSLILRKQGKKKEAEEVLKKAMPMANEVSLNAYGYGLLYNIKDVEGAIEIFKINVKDHPKSWNVYDSLAEAYQTKGNKTEAIKNYKKALGLAPEGQKQRIESTIEALSS